MKDPASTLAGYSLAFLGTGVVLAVRLLLWPVLGGDSPLLIFFPSVIVSSYYAGLRPGLVATLLSAVGGSFFLIEPRYSFAIGSVREAYSLGLFVFTGAFISGLSEAFHRAQRHVVANERLRAEYALSNEHVRAEQALRETEEQFRQVMANIREIFWMCADQDDRFVYVNPSYEAVWGRTVQSLYEQPRSWGESFHQDDRERAQDCIERSRRGQLAEGEFRMLRPDGSLRWIHLRTFPIKNRDGRVMRIGGFAEDFTERRARETAEVNVSSRNG